jgi:biopolymer transport protein ExbD
MSFRSISSPDAWSSSSGDDEALLSSINTTPLVDVMLVLLIIFLITVPVVRQTVPLSLPKERNTARELKAQTIEISVTRDGALFWNGQALADAAALSARLASIAKQEPQPEVQVRGDEAAPYARVGRVVDACQRAGIRKLGFITEPPAR